MFKIVIPDSKAWKNLMNAISTLVEEASFDITPEGVKLRAMDPSHVAMVDFEYPKTAFQEYVCSEPTKLCVDIGDMLKLMKRVESGETLELSLDTETSKLVMKLTGKYTRRFSLPLLQPTTTEMPTPKLTFDAKIKMDADCLSDAVNDIAVVSEQIKFEANPEKFVLSGLGETGNVVVEFEKTNNAILEFQVNGEAKALYGISFLQDMVKAGTASSKVSTVEFSTDKPVKIDFELPLQGKLTYYLAPRIE
ncbi:proliferating cell nuclear antigen (pcna) [Candidatus Bathyarchaeota archaeon]|nr:MAG: proliferating cell nuclear antigen (pcna) [Candidatus Bathyarchaeota archaeon]